jgi:hypothetical protein
MCTECVNLWAEAERAAKAERLERVGGKPGLFARAGLELASREMHLALRFTEFSVDMMLFWGDRARHYRDRTVAFADLADDAARRIRGAG